MKAHMFRSYRLFCVILFVLGLISPAFAVVTQPALTLIVDTNGDGIAGIGDQVEFSCRSSAAVAGDFPNVRCLPLGISRLVLVNAGGTYYTAPPVTLSAGNIDNGAFGAGQVQFFDNDGGPIAPGNNISVDNERPRSNNGIVLSAGYANGTVGKYIAGDTLHYTITFQDQDGLNNRLTVVVNLSNLGGGTAVPLTWSGGGTYTLSYPLPLNREGNGLTFDMVARDDAGQEYTAASAISMDTRRPTFTGASVANSNGSQFVKVGDTVTITAVLQAYDGDTVTASNTLLFGAIPITLARQGTTSTFQHTFVLASGSYDGTTRFDLTATDDDGNVGTAQTNSLSFDALPPEFFAINIQILDPVTRIPKPSPGKIGDILSISATLNGGETDIQRMTVDLTSVGGISNHLFQFIPASNTFYLEYILNQYTSEDSIVRFFNVIARDNGGNQVTDVTLPPVYIDNLPPTITMASMEKVSGASWAKINDVIRFTANVNNIDGGSVSVNLSELGGPVRAQLNNVGGTTFRYDFTLPAFSTNPPVDRNWGGNIRVTDNAGNLVEQFTNELSVDNEPPVIVNATYTVTPDFSPTHPWVRINDIVTFRVQLASSGAIVHDGESVTVNLSPLGSAYSSAQVMTYDGVNTYQYAVTVPAGTLNNFTPFAFIAKDNAENPVSGNIIVKIDNYAPVVGPMTVRYLVDYTNVDTVNLGDRMEFLVPCSDQDGGTCTIDLSYIGGAAFHNMDYDPTLQVYSTVVDTASASNENSAYVFRARVTDKAGNLTSSLSGPYPVDCVPPVVYYASATYQELVGSSTVVNVGDKITITASVQNSRLDGGVPTVNLAEFGLSSAQQLYDDGAHGDGAPNDGIWAYQFVVAKGTINADFRSFVVAVTDNAGNSASRTTNALFIDNQPLNINYYLASIDTDANGNAIADLDGSYGVTQVVTTDTIKLSIRVTGAEADFNICTVDLTKLGYTDVASEMPVLSAIPGQRDYQKIFTLREGTTNREMVTFSTLVTDINGNQTFATATPQIMVDNFPPVISQVFPITFVTDSIPTGEANLGDRIQIKVRVSNHDGNPPEVDFSNLLSANGLSSTTPIVQMSGGPTEYTYTWTTPEGLGSLASLPILVWDASKNLRVGYTNAIRFLSTKPNIMGYSSSKAVLSSDTYPTVPNNICNPTDQVTITAVLNKAFNPTNTPPATVCVDIRSIANDSSDDAAGYLDGDPKTYWTPLNYQPLESGAGSFVYRSTFTAGPEGRTDVTNASFAAKVLHPDYTSIVMASATIYCDPLNPFGIDTLVPRIWATQIRITNENGDNISSTVANIGDVITVYANIADYADPGSVTARILTYDNQLIEEATMNWLTGDQYYASFVVATNTVVPWNFTMNGNPATDYLRYEVLVTDDAQNAHYAAGRSDVGQPKNFLVDNTPADITAFSFILNPNHPFDWVGNVGSAPITVSGQYDNARVDRLGATITLNSGARQAFVDMTSIQATSTFMIINTTLAGGLTTGTTPAASYIRLATVSVELEPALGPGTYSLPIYVIDTAGNRTASQAELAFDTTRPYLMRAEYDGSYLTLQFNEPLKVGDYTLPMEERFDQTKIRIGNKSDLTLVTPSSVVALSPLDLVEDPYADTDTIRIALASGTRATIADWGNVSIWMSMGATGATGEGASVSIDLAGNWVNPIRQSAGRVINVPVPYAIKPKIIGGSYDAVNVPSILYIDFDKPMATDTMTDLTLPPFAIVRERRNDLRSVYYPWRYNPVVGSDTVGVPSSTTRLAINLSPEAQDWIAIKFGRLASQLNYAVSTATPPLVRDEKGNAVQPISFENAVAAALYPENRTFDVDTSGGNEIVLHLASKTLTIPLNRRALIWGGEFADNTPKFNPDYNRLNVIPSRIFLYKRADMTGSSISLNRAANNLSIWPTYNTMFASTTVIVPLSDDDIRDILSWNTGNLYVAMNSGAFKDLWGNDSTRYPSSTTTAAQIRVVKPDGYPGPQVISVAVSDPTPTKGGYAPGTLFYEVDFQTAVLPGGIILPINRDRIPVLTIQRQDNWLGTDFENVDVASFVTWVDYTVNGQKRTAARFANTSPLSSAIATPPAGFPAMANISNVWDVFDTQLEPTPGASPSYLASYVYDLNKRINSGTGFSQAASEPWIIDPIKPTAISVSPSGTTIGITPAGSSIFFVTFDEDMDSTPGRNPNLRLGTAGGTAMNFQFERWAGPRVAYYYNTDPFNANTQQGTFTYYVTGGYDLAGNQANDSQPGQLTIRSKGPIVNTYTVTTYPFTTAKETWPTGAVTGKPFSPYVPNHPVIPGGIATITVNFTSDVAGAVLWLHFYNPSGGTSLASFPMLVETASNRYVEWDGTFNGTAIGQTGPTTYELRVYDDFGNEASKRGTIIYDGRAPQILRYNISHASPLRWDGKYYFSPAVHSYVKVDAIGVAAGEEIRMRAVYTGVSTDTFTMSPLSGSGYTYSWDGKSSYPGNAQVPDAEYMINIVDGAGNLGVPLGVLGVATAAIVIDSDPPSGVTFVTERTDDGAATRFNPTVVGQQLRVKVSAPGLSSGSAMIRVKAGATVVRDVYVYEIGIGEFEAIWDGKDSNGNFVTDGTYRIHLIDLAENQSQAYVDVDVVSSVFKVTSATEIDNQTIRLTFSQLVKVSDAGNAGNYQISPVLPSGIGIVSVASVSGNVVELKLNQIMAHATVYTITVTPGFRSIDDDLMLAGNNSAQFTADGLGPVLTNITYDGVTSQKEFNVVFDETLNQTTAEDESLYFLTVGTQTVPILNASLRSDKKSVRMTLNADLTEGVSYTLTASGVEDLYKNKSDGTIAKTFTGRDVTAPSLTVSVFSNPGNEYDISIAVLANEDLNGAPSATVTQSGGQTQAVVLSAGPTTRLYLGGAHLDKNFPGVVTVKVTGKDVSGNTGVTTVSFSTAYVNASVRAEVRSADQKFAAIFPVGSLKENSLVTVVSTGLTKVPTAANRRAAVRPSILANISGNKSASLVAALGEGTAGDELVPVEQAYMVNIPTGRLQGNLEVALQTVGALPAGTALFRQIDGKWVFAGRNVKDNHLRATVDRAGLFALLKDEKAPRANLLTKVDSDKPLTASRPTFEWAVAEDGAGLDLDACKARLNGIEMPVTYDAAAGKMIFVPSTQMVSGQYGLTLEMHDLAGNVTVTPEIRFKLDPALQIFEVTQYPNPAARRATIRISTNRQDIDASLIDVSIYDSNGDRVASGRNLFINSTNLNTRVVHDVQWDLVNDDGRRVANGIYFAKITVRDPDNWEKKSRVTHKIAVLR